MSQAFELHPRLAADCECILDWPLCRVLLMRDRRFQWFVLVPRRNGLRELCELEFDEGMQFLRESNSLSKYLLSAYVGNKLNIAALGNMVPQLHVHHILRREDDACWPGPVWGCGTPAPYPESELQALVAKVRHDLASENINARA